MGVATGDVGAVKSPPAHHARFKTFCMSKYQFYVISTHKYSVITEKHVI